MATRTKERPGAEKTARKTSKTTCVHHWRIESPNGRESEGVCRRCGKTRSFANSNEAVMWEHTNTLRNTGKSFSISRSEGGARLSDEVVADD